VERLKGLLRIFKVFIDEIPVDEVPEGFDEIGAFILVINIVRSAKSGSMFFFQLHSF